MSTNITWHGTQEESFALVNAIAQLYLSIWLDEGTPQRLPATSDADR
jgi:hypothetical protein